MPGLAWAPFIAALFMHLASAQDLHAAAPKAKSGSIRIEYLAPKSPEHRPVFELIKQRRVLERVRELLAPIRLARPLLVKTEGCDGESNAWYDEGAITICYEFIDDVWKGVPAETTAAGVAPIDIFIGPIVDTVLHEAGHAVFELLRIPLFGREEDAADQFSAYILLQFGKEDARRLISGAAYQYVGDLGGLKTVSMPVTKFADVHGTPAQRFFNLLCIAYGADEELFGDLVVRGYLPKERAEDCEDEYRQAAYAHAVLIRPHIDRARARKVVATKLPPVNTPMPKYRELPDGQKR
jgi:hypothetical protein